MVFRPISCLLCGILCSFVSAAVAQETYVSISQNPSFETNPGPNQSEVPGWNFNQVDTLPIPRSFGPAVPVFGNVFAATAENRVSYRLRGAGGFGQTISSGLTGDHYLLRFFGFTDPIEAGTTGSAVVAVSFYDAAWNEVDKFEVPIPPRPLNGFSNAYRTLGLYKPPSAVHAFIFVWIFDNNTRVTIDDLELLRVELPTFVGANLLLNEKMSFTPFFDQPFTNYGLQSGNEFWSMVRDWQDPIRNEFGSSLQPEYAFQGVELVPGRTYLLELDGIQLHPDMGDLLGFSVGVDFYDQDWNWISSQRIGLQYGDPATDAVRESRIITPPAGTAHSSVYIFSPQLDGTDTARLRVERIAISEN